MTVSIVDPRELLGACRAICDASRLGAASDAIGATPASVVATPSSREQAARLLSRTDELGASITFAGHRTKIDIGASPTSLDLVIATHRLDALIEHNPGDLVVRAEAGMPLARLQAELAGSGQWLALDPIESGATLGGVVAANASGPRRLRYGTARDLLIGITAILADGTIARSGGKVVKNVAGYDLGKLMTGSYGTLALLVDLTFRLHPRLGASAVVTTPIDGPFSAEQLVRAYREATLSPSAFELLLDARSLTGEAIAVFESTGSAAEQQARAAGGLRADSAIAKMPPERFGARGFAPGQVGLRLAHETSAIALVLELIGSRLAAAGLEGRVVAHLGVGVTEVGFSGADPSAAAALVDELRAGVAGVDGSVIVISAPNAIAPALDVWGPVPGIELMRRVKEQFDPRRRLAPGRFVGGI